MSQQKVDKYKQEKAHRSEIIKKQKRSVRIEILVAVLVAVGLVGWFGWSYHARAEKTKPPVDYPINSSAIDDYLSDLNASDDEAEDTAEEEATEEATEEEQ